MVITDQCIVSSNIAKPLKDTENFGFMFFYDYVMRSEVRIGKWHLIYENKVFSIYYLSENDGDTDEELMYSAIEIDKTSTYKMVIYIIGKVSKFIDNWSADNFKKETYEMVVRNG